MYNEVDGDIITYPTQIIAHQTNCVTNTWSGVAKAIFEAFPFSNTYKNRTDEEPHRFKKNSYHREGNSIWICNMYAQFYPGTARDGINKGKYSDTTIDRVAAFKACLHDLGWFCGVYQLRTVTFPDHVGCGLAGGRWEIYRKMLMDFAEKNDLLNVTVVNNENV